MSTTPVTYLLDHLRNNAFPNARVDIFPKYNFQFFPFIADFLNRCNTSSGIIILLIGKPVHPIPTGTIPAYAAKSVDSSTHGCWF